MKKEVKTILKSTNAEEDNKEGDVNNEPLENDEGAAEDQPKPEE